jgi:hypothetical protein
MAKNGIVRCAKPPVGEYGGQDQDSSRGNMNDRQDVQLVGLSATASGASRAANPVETALTSSPSEAIAKRSWTDLATHEDEKCGTAAPGCSLK